MGMIRGTVRRGAVSVSSSDAGGQVLRAETLEDDIRDDVEYFEPYGFTATPPGDAEAVVLAVGGHQAHSVAVCMQDRSVRPATEPGESILYNSDQGSYVKLYADGTIGIGYNDVDSVQLDTDGNVKLIPTGGSGLVHIGADTAAEFVVLATKLTTELNVLKAAISSAPVTPMDGGAAFKAAIVGALGSWPGDIAATKAKAT